MSKNATILILAIAAIAVASTLAMTYAVTDSDSEVTDVEIIDSYGTYEKHASVGEKYTVALKGNVTTGYDWKLVSSDDLKLVKDWYVADSNAQGLCGVGGVHYFEFDCEKARNYKIVLDYQRSWEGSEGSVVTVNLTVE